MIWNEAIAQQNSNSDKKKNKKKKKKKKVERAEKKWDWDITDRQYDTIRNVCEWNILLSPVKRLNK